ncbi:GNAT family N-acetyltransferase [Salinarchaeum laminariae]|uniref:GNAT family N-acetyltransferase n=1 Tax=Salinarchaeum laminariae TaxID=869888 RepID=UPI0020BE0470|nr:N-acetyltransferase [Salinarchaeum laminariae]
MSVTVETRSVAPGSDEYLEAAWELKERIRRSEGVLKQRRGFFADAFRRSRVHVLLADEELVGFAAVRRDGYVLFLAIATEYRGQGFGERLIARVAEANDSITCHARASNEDALGFYESLGFQIQRRIDNYYEDGGDAYYLKLGEDTGLTSKITDALR